MSLNYTIEHTQDFTDIWPLFKHIVANTDTFIYYPEITQEEAKTVWMGPNVFIVRYNQEVIATYRIRPNQLQRGNHIANASFMVHPEFQGKGIGKALGLDAIKRAKRLGYRGLQFNMVVKHNKKSIQLWLSLGFDIIGTIPEAYLMSDNSYADAHIVYKKLV